jgi:hypothetical protein
VGYLWGIARTVITMPKKNSKKEKVVLNSAAGDEPCRCGHVRRSHLGDGGNMCFACYADTEPKIKWLHAFTLDNLALVEKLYNQRELERFKKEFENGK